MMMFFLFALLFCFMCYKNLDPMKSSFFLILSLLVCMPMISFGSNIWYSYFICMLFLSGIFVILVYFSSLSKINFVTSKGLFFSMLITLFFVFPILFYYSFYINLGNFYFNNYLFVVLFLILILLIFMNFSSYFLNFSGALRKF